jgi:hypothetical protein
VHSVQLTEGIYICTCGAKALKKQDFKRFLSRHPSLCSKTQKEKQVKLDFTKQVAQGTRSVPGSEEADTNFSDKNCLLWLRDVLDHGTGLTAWEIGFINNMEQRRKKNDFYLTINMRTLLRKVYEDRVVANA